MIELRLRHIDETENSTVSALVYGNHHLCYIIEDGHRDSKVAGETRIPSGRYEIIPRREGGFYNRYTARWPHHSFVPWLIDVPGFTWILIHIGNFIGNTRGCLLTNTEYRRNKQGNFYGLHSTDAYLRVYEFLESMFNAGERIFITIDRGQVQPIEEPEVIAEEPEFDMQPPFATTQEKQTWWQSLLKTAFPWMN
ncbi:MAG: DUF5675 family protein [Bacteroidota bacterium]